MPESRISKLRFKTMFGWRQVYPTIIYAQCGLCETGYDTELEPGERKILSCPECQNTNVQVVIGE